MIHTSKQTNAMKNYGNGIFASDDRLAAMEQQLAGLATAPGLRSPGVSRTMVWMGGSFLAGFAVAVGIMVEVSSAWNCSWTCRAAVA